jgi:hypothetical protein
MTTNQNTTSQPKIVNVFSIFHDGTIVSWVGNRERLRLTISCSYLAERVNSTYEDFFVEILKIDRLAFVPWMNPADLEQEYLTEVADIFKANLDILSAECDNDLVKISFNQRNSGFDYCGGFLYMTGSDIRVLDQSGSEIATDRLYEICRQYWDDFANKNK